MSTSNARIIILRTARHLEKKITETKVFKHKHSEDEPSTPFFCNIDHPSE